MKEIEKLKEEIQAMRLSVQNHNETVEQNRGLQSELRRKDEEIEKLNKKIAELEKRPFFPYPMNNGGRQDFGEFYLISHAWFSFLDEKRQVGLVEVEWKPSGKRCIYLGLGSGVANLQMFEHDVRKIALYGSKVKEFTK